MKKLLLFTAALMLSLSLGAQELANFVGTGNTASPEIKDGKITFRLPIPADIAVGYYLPIYP